MTTPTITYPVLAPITPAGQAHLTKGDLPQMAYTSFDGAVVFNLIGPYAIFDRTKPERVQLNGLKGLVAPWENIEQKGATQDGSTYVTSLYDPMDVELTVTIYGRDPIYRRQVLRHWIDSWDPKQPGQLSWNTKEMGNWWADVRWAKTVVDPVLGPYRRQRLGMVAKAYDAFWRTDDSVDDTTTNTSGTLTRLNIGDQPMWDRFTLVGPGTFTMGQANSTATVVLGPLQANQIVQVRCNPRLRGVVDLTSTPNSPQQLTQLQKTIAELQSLWSNFNVLANPPVDSIFGVQAPQGNVYSLLQGRFSNPIPPKPPGVDFTAVQPYNIPVSISGGAAGSAIYVAGTPLRRYP